MYIWWYESILRQWFILHTLVYISFYLLLTSFKFFSHIIYLILNVTSKRNLFCTWVKFFKYRLRWKLGNLSSKNTLFSSVLDKQA